MIMRYSQIKEKTVSLFYKAYGFSLVDDQGLERWFGA